MAEHSVFKTTIKPATNPRFDPEIFKGFLLSMGENVYSYDALRGMAEDLRALAEHLDDLASVLSQLAILEGA